MEIRKHAAIVVALFLLGCDSDRSLTYTLYRNSPLDSAMRVHWATFDADDKGAFNEGNCWLAAKLLNQQAPNGVRWWCEKGEYRP